MDPDSYLVRDRVSAHLNIVNDYKSRLILSAGMHRNFGSRPTFKRFNSYDSEDEMNEPCSELVSTDRHLNLDCVDPPVYDDRTNSSNKLKKSSAGFSVFQFLSGFIGTKSCHNSRTNSFNFGKKVYSKPMLDFASIYEVFQESYLVEASLKSKTTMETAQSVLAESAAKLASGLMKPDLSKTKNCMYPIYSTHCQGISTTRSPKNLNLAFATICNGEQEIMRSIPQAKGIRSNDSFTSTYAGVVGSPVSNSDVEEMMGVETIYTDRYDNTASCRNQKSPKCNHVRKSYPACDKNNNKRECRRECKFDKKNALSSSNQLPTENFKRSITGQAFIEESDIFSKNSGLVGDIIDTRDNAKICFTLHKPDEVITVNGFPKKCKDNIAKNRKRLLRRKEQRRKRKPIQKAEVAPEKQFLETRGSQPTLDDIGSDLKTQSKTCRTDISSSIPVVNLCVPPLCPNSAIAFILGVCSDVESEPESDWDLESSDESWDQNDDIWESFQQCAQLHLSNLESSIQTTPFQTPQCDETDSVVSKNNDGYVAVADGVNAIETSTPCWTSALVLEVNQRWLQNIELEWPKKKKTAKKVQFASGSALETVYRMDKWALEYEAARKGHWEVYVRDRARFETRICDVEKVLNPILTEEHRSAVFRRLYSNLSTN